MSWKVAGEIGKVVGAPLVGGLFSSNAASKAAKEKATSNAAALAWEKEQYAQEQAAAKAQWEAQEAQQAPYRAARHALAQRLGARYGITVPDMVTPTYPGMATGGGRVGGEMPTNTSPGGLTLSKLAGLSPTGGDVYGREASPSLTPALAPPPIMTLGELGRRA